MDYRRKLGKKWQNQKSKKLAKRIPPLKPFIEKPIKSVAILGFYSTPSGLGQAARLLSAQLQANNIKITQLDCANTSFKDNQYSIENANFDAFDAIIFAVNPDVVFSVLKNFDFTKLDGKKIIGYWVWELPNPSKNWEIAKNLVHEIWTPSLFSKNALQQIFHQDIRVVHHPAAILPPPKISTQTRECVRSRLQIPNNAFIAFQSIAFSSSMERKNVLGAIDVFIKAFSKNDNVFFIIRYHGAKEYPKSLERLKHAASQRKNQILLIEAQNSSTELFEFYAASDIYMSLHRSEGFGLNIAEAMLAGLPVMVTNWSGNLEFCDSENSILIDCELTKVKDDEGVYGNNSGLWAAPFASDAIIKLRECKNNPQSLVKLAQKAKESIENKLSATKLF